MQRMVRTDRGQHRGARTHGLLRSRFALFPTFGADFGARTHERGTHRQANSYANGPNRPMRCKATTPAPNATKCNETTRRCLATNGAIGETPNVPRGTFVSYRADRLSLATNHAHRPL